MIIYNKENDTNTKLVKNWKCKCLSTRIILWGSGGGYYYYGEPSCEGYAKIAFFQILQLRMTRIRILWGALRLVFVTFILLYYSSLFSCFLMQLSLLPEILTATFFAVNLKSCSLHSVQELTWAMWKYEYVHCSFISN